MFCNNCGTNNPDNARICDNCGAALHASRAANPAPQQAAPALPKDYMTANIILLIVSLLCAGGCIGMILSIIGIIFGSQAKAAYGVGDHVTGDAKAKIAKIMMIVTIIMVIIGLIATAVILLLYGAAIFAVIAEEMNLALMLL